MILTLSDIIPDDQKFIGSYRELVSDVRKIIDGIPSQDDQQKLLALMKSTVDRAKEEAAVAIGEEVRRTRVEAVEETRNEFLHRR